MSEEQKKEIVKKVFGSIHFQKIVSFAENQHIYAKFLIRIYYDGLKKAEFFRMVIRGYLDKDPDFMLFLKKTKEKLSKKIKEEGRQRRGMKTRLSRTKIEVIEKINKREKENLLDFALSEEEIQNIFDDIEIDEDI